MSFMGVSYEYGKTGFRIWGHGLNYDCMAPTAEELIGAYDVLAYECNGIEYERREWPRFGEVPMFECLLCKQSVLAAGFCPDCATERVPS